MNTKGLGKGFDILVPVGIDVSTVAASSSEKVHRLALDVVVPKQDQPRQYFDEPALDQLAYSIREHGILQPLVVVQLEQNMYSIIAGERRWRAARIAGLTEVPAIIRSATEHEQLELALLENVQRADLSALEQANTIFRLHTQFGQSYEDIAKRLGKAYTTVVNSVRLLNLPPEMQESLSIGTINEGHARALLSLQKDTAAQKTLFANIVSKGWSVRQAEQFAIVVKRGPTNDKPIANKAVKAHYADTAKAIEKQLDTKVTVRHSAKGKGTLVISYGSDEELTRIANKIIS
jgi:ParB family chromosome partitioning protein